MKSNISAVVMSHNNEDIIGKTIKSLDWCGEIIVIDDNSTDKTREVSKKYGAKVIKRSLLGDFASQRNYAYKVAKNSWLFFVDSDEIVTDEIKIEILNNINDSKQNDVSAFWMRRKDYFLDILLRHGPAGDAYFGRLLKKNKTKWVGTIFEYPEVEGRSVYLKERLIHNRKESISDLVQKANFYSNLEADLLFSKGIKSNYKTICFDPIKRFFQYYFIQKAFLDGVMGFIFVILASVLVKFLTQVKLWAKWHYTSDKFRG